MKCKISQDLRGKGGASLHRKLVICLTFLFLALFLVLSTETFAISGEDSSDGSMSPIQLGSSDAWEGHSKLESSPAFLDFSKITVTTDAKTYNAEEQTQIIDSGTYQLNTDYVVQYFDNTDAGIAKILVTGKGNYIGSKLYTFEISPADISEATVELGDVLTYTGEEQTQNVKSVKVGGLTLSTGDFTVEKNKAKNAGLYSLEVTGKGNYSGSRIYNFEVRPADISLATVELGGVLTYTGEEQTQNVKSVKVGGLTLSTGDFTVEKNKATNAGLYRLEVTGKGNFAGTVTQAFIITRLDITYATVTLDGSLTYTGKKQTQGISSVKVGSVTLNTTDYKVSGNTGTTAKKYDTMKIEGRGNCIGSITGVEFEIAKAPITVSWNNTSFTYDKASHKPFATFTGTQGTDKITLSVSGEQTNANAEGEQYEATASLTGWRASNYEITEATKTVKFTIAQLDVSSANVTLSDALTYTSEEQKQKVSKVEVDGVVLTEGVDYDLYGNVATSAGTYNMTVRGKASCKGAKENLEFEIAKAPITLSWDEKTDFIYNTKAQKPSAKITSGILGTDEVNVTIEGEQKKANAEGEQYEATASLTGGRASNYEIAEATKTVKFTIAQLDITSANVTLSDALTYTSEEQEQKVSVEVDGVELTEGVDYDLSGNVATSAGTYNMNVRAIASCKGAKENLEFEIAKAPITVSWNNTSFTYDKDPHKPFATFTGNQGTDTVILSVSGEQTDANAEGEQYEATASLDDISTSNYEITEATKTIKFTIAQLDITNANVTLGKALTYKARKQEQRVSKVEVDGVKLAEGIDYDLSGNVEFSAGTYKMAVRGKENCKGAKEDIEFEIAKAPITVSWYDTSFTYDKASHKPYGRIRGAQGYDIIHLSVSGEQTDANAEGEQYEATASLTCERASTVQANCNFPKRHVC